MMKTVLQPLTLLKLVVVSRLLQSIAAQTCSIEWNIQPYMEVPGGTPYPALGTLVECLRGCEGTPTCLAAAWRENTPQCWIYSKLIEMAAIEPATNKTILFVVESRSDTCYDCKGVWDVLNSTNRDYGHRLQAANITHCQQICLRDPQCKALDWDPENRACYLHITATTNYMSLRYELGFAYYSLTSRTCTDPTDDSVNPTRRINADDTKSAMFDSSVVKSYLIVILSVLGLTVVVVIVLAVITMCYIYHRLNKPEADDGYEKPVLGNAVHYNQAAQEAQYDVITN